MNSDRAVIVELLEVLGHLRVITKEQPIVVTMGIQASAESYIIVQIVVKEACIALINIIMD